MDDALPADAAADGRLAADLPDPGPATTLVPRPSAAAPERMTGRGRETAIRVLALRGGVDIVVPDDMVLDR